MKFEKGQVVQGVKLLEKTTLPANGRIYPAWVVREIYTGELRITREAQLKSGRASAPKLGPVETALKIVFRDYQSRCRNRNIYFDIPLLAFQELVQKPCEYCGAPPSNNKNGVKYSGLDRKDNRQGYTVGNVVPCCSPCNQVKSNVLTHKEMKAAMAAVLQMRRRRKR